ncbi:MAG: NUDIX domain-containing protein [Candidatus Diapherotrites archaeon]|uniref:NUDIX domain-containing protein n=1 Tax=Candidatus Iainarchaeum sp. TaxID=3101447 RepID=A0A938YNG7_9ARCH|nr:NUDIX domain-containing protein [Candidatus Diapherotrites archaeon]
MAKSPLGKPGLDFVGVGIGVMVRNNKGEFLLGMRTGNVRNEPGRWCFPGGALEFGETLFDCAKREAFEEAGIEVEPVRLVKVIDHIIPGEKQHWVNPIIEAMLVKGKPKVAEPGKLSEWRWFSLENLPENLTLNMLGFFKDIKEGRVEI